MGCPGPDYGIKRRYESLKGEKSVGNIETERETGLLVSVRSDVVGLVRGVERGICDGRSSIDSTTGVSPHRHDQK